MITGFYIYVSEEEKYKKTKLMPGDKIVIFENSRTISFLRDGKIISWAEKISGQSTYHSEFSIKNFRRIAELISKVAGIGEIKEPLYEEGGKIEIELCLKE